jgi:hypothetical protein
MKRYRLEDAGCYADGAHGHHHCRETLARLIEGIYPLLAKEIRGEPSDDLSEEDEALSVLTDYCEEGCWFEFVDGDLLLVADARQWGVG